MSKAALVPGTPYQRLARTDRYRWWKPLVELVVFVALWFAGTYAVVVAAGEYADADGLGGLLFLILGLAILIPAAFAAAACVRRPGALSSVLGRLRWRFLAAALATVLAIKLAAIALDAAVTGQAFAWPGTAAVLPLLAVIVVGVPLQSAAEEYGFRGTLLQALGAWIPIRWIPVVLTSVVFAWLHAPETWLLGLTLGVTGLACAVLAIQTGGLEAAIALHAGNNVAAFAWEAAAGRSDVWISNLNVDIQPVSIAIGIASDVVAFVLLLRLARRRQLVTAA